MSSLEKRKRYRLRDSINGRKGLTVIKDLGIYREPAEKVQADYDRARTLGFVPNLERDSFEMVSDIRAFLQAIKEGRDVPPPKKAPAKAFESWIIDTVRDPKTVKIYRGAFESFVTYKKPVDWPDYTKEAVDEWRADMASGKLKWRGHALNKKGELVYGKKWHRYAPTTIKIMVSALKSFLMYCAGEDFISAKIPLKIRIAKVPSTRRFLTRPEAARLLRASRVGSYEQKGSGRRIPREIEVSVLNFSLRNPTFGKNRVARECGAKISPNGVSQVWKRYAVETARKRVQWREANAVGDTLRLPTEVKRERTLVENPYANNRLRKILLFGLYTGMRTGEVLRATWDNVTASEVIRRQKDGRLVSTTIYALFIPKAKKNKQRTVALHPRIARIIGAAKRAGTSGPLFPAWTESALSQARRRAVGRAGLARVRFHDLRHSFVRNYLKSGAGSIAQLREHTGHENLSSLDPYAHFANADVAATIPNMKVQ